MAWWDDHLKPFVDSLLRTEGRLKWPARILVWSLTVVLSLGGICGSLYAMIRLWDEVSRRVVPPRAGPPMESVQPSGVILLTVAPQNTVCGIDGTDRTPPYDVLTVGPGHHEIECRAPGYG